MTPLSRALAVIGLLASWCVCGPAAPAIYTHFPAEMAGPMQTAQVESVSGRITAVAGNTFTLEPRSPEKNGAKSLTIAIDQDTVVHGKIAVGLQVDVTFRRQDHNNIAVTVRTSA